jgi:hypothetical protein
MSEEGLWNIILERDFPNYSSDRDINPLHRAVQFCFVTRKIPDKIEVLEPNIIVLHESLRLVTDEVIVNLIIQNSIDRLHGRPPQNASECLRPWLHYPEPQISSDPQTLQILAMFDKIKQNNPMMDDISVQKLAIDMLLQLGVDIHKIVDIYAKHFIL